MCARRGAIDPQAQVQRAESDRDRPAGPEQVCRDRATEEAVVESQRGDVPPTSTGEPVQAPDQRGLTRRAVLRYADLQVFLWVTHRLVPSLSCTRPSCTRNSTTWQVQRRNERQGIEIGPGAGANQDFLLLAGEVAPAATCVARIELLRVDETQPDLLPVRLRDAAGAVLG